MSEVCLCQCKHRRSQSTYRHVGFRNNLIIGEIFSVPLFQLLTRNNFKYRSVQKAFFQCEHVESDLVLTRHALLVTNLALKKLTQFSPNLSVLTALPNDEIGLLHEKSRGRRVCWGLRSRLSSSQKRILHQTNIAYPDESDSRQNITRNAQITLFHFTPFRAVYFRIQVVLTIDFDPRRYPFPPFFLPMVNKNRYIIPNTCCNVKHCRKRREQPKKRTRKE